MSNLYLFDCFGVVISDVSTLWMQNRFSQEQIDYARNRVFTQVDCGKMSFDNCMQVLAQMSGQTKQDVYDQWDALTYPLAETLPILQQLKSTHTVALLSNAASDYLHGLFERFSLDKYFHKLFVSAEMGCAKPGKEIYQKCLASFTEKFDQVYFVDDNPANLVQPSQMGIKTVQFVSAEKLKRELELC